MQAGSNRLIVFDDVKNPDDLVGLVPHGEGVRVLVTTTRLAGWEGAGWVHVPVGVFEREQSIGILLDRKSIIFFALSAVTFHFL